MKTKDAVEKIKKVYPDAILDVVTFKNQITLSVKPENAKQVLTYLKESYFETLIDLTAVDYLEPKPKTKLVYHLLDPKDYGRLRVTTEVDRDQSADSVCSVWAGANWYERELFDLFGVEFKGHPDLKRLLMPDNWEGFPLRKDYALTEESVQFKNNVKPKVPSEIIPHVKTRSKKQ